MFGDAWLLKFNSVAWEEGHKECTRSRSAWSLMNDCMKESFDEEGEAADGRDDAVTVALPLSLSGEPAASGGDIDELSTLLAWALRLRDAWVLRCCRMIASSMPLSYRTAERQPPLFSRYNLACPISRCERFDRNKFQSAAHIHATISSIERSICSGAGVEPEVEAWPLAWLYVATSFSARPRTKAMRPKMDRQFS